MNLLCVKVNDGPRNSFTGACRNVNDGTDYTEVKVVIETLLCAVGESLGNCSKTLVSESDLISLQSSANLVCSEKDSRCELSKVSCIPKKKGRWITKIKECQDLDDKAVRKSLLALSLHKKNSKRKMDRLRITNKINKEQFHPKIRKFLKQPAVRKKATRYHQTETLRTRRNVVDISEDKNVSVQSKFDEHNAPVKVTVEVVNNDTCVDALSHSNCMLNAIEMKRNYDVRDEKNLEISKKRKPRIATNLKNFSSILRRRSLPIISYKNLHLITPSSSEVDDNRKHNRKFQNHVADNIEGEKCSKQIDVCEQHREKKGAASTIACSRTTSRDTIASALGFNGMGMEHVIRAVASTRKSKGEVKDISEYDWKSEDDVAGTDDLIRKLKSAVSNLVSHRTKSRDYVKRIPKYNKKVGTIKNKRKRRDHAISTSNYKWNQRDGVNGTTGYERKQTSGVASTMTYKTKQTGGVIGKIRYKRKQRDDVIGTTKHKRKQKSRVPGTVKYKSKQKSRVTGTTKYKKKQTDDAIATIHYKRKQRDGVITAKCERKQSSHVTGTAKYERKQRSRATGTTKYKRKQRSRATGTTKYKRKQKNRATGTTEYKMKQKSRATRTTKYKRKQTDGVIGKTKYKRKQGVGLTGTTKRNRRLKRNVIDASEHNMMPADRAIDTTEDNMIPADRAIDTTEDNMISTDRAIDTAERDVIPADRSIDTAERSRITGNGELNKPKRKTRSKKSIVDTLERETESSGFTRYTRKGGCPGINRTLRSRRGDVTSKYAIEKYKIKTQNKKEGGRPRESSSGVVPKTAYDNDTNDAVDYDCLHAPSTKDDDTGVDDEWDFDDDGNTDNSEHKIKWRGHKIHKTKSPVTNAVSEAVWELEHDKRKTIGFFRKRHCCWNAECILCKEKYDEWTRMSIMDFEDAFDVYEYTGYVYKYFKMYDSYPKIRVDEEFVEIKFHSGYQGNAYSVFNVGGPICAMDWIVSVDHPYLLALSTCSDRNEMHPFDLVSSSPSSIQILNCATPIPNLELIIVGDFGCVWSLMWLPFKPDKDSFGFLVAGCSSGAVYVFRVPLRHDKALVSLNGKLALTAGTDGSFGQCFSLAYSHSDPHFICAGYADGYVVLFNIDTPTSPFVAEYLENSRVKNVYPVKVSQPADIPVKDVKFFPNSHTTVLVSYIILKEIWCWNLVPDNRLLFKLDCCAAELYCALHSCLILAGTDNSSRRQYNSYLKVLNIPLRTSFFTVGLPVDASIQSIDCSEFFDVVALCTSTGSLYIYKLSDVNKLKCPPLLNTILTLLSYVRYSKDDYGELRFERETFETMMDKGYLKFDVPKFALTNKFQPCTHKDNFAEHDVRRYNLNALQKVRINPNPHSKAMIATGGYAGYLILFYPRQ